jgi:hypothetical protein
MRLSGLADERLKQMSSDHPYSLAAENGNSDFDGEDSYDLCTCKPANARHNEIWNDRAHYEPVSWNIGGANKRLRERVGERDKWICQICFELIDRKLIWPHPKSAVSDHHPIPAMADGPTIMCNLRIAHHICNMRDEERVVNKFTEEIRQGMLQFLELNDVLPCPTMFSSTSIIAVQIHDELLRSLKKKRRTIHH